MNPLLLLMLVALLAGGVYYAVSPAAGFGGDEAKALYSWFNKMVNAVLELLNRLWLFLKNTLWSGLKSFYNAFMTKLKEVVFGWFWQWITANGSKIGVALGLDFDGDSCFNPVEDLTALIRSIAADSEHSGDVGGSIDNVFAINDPDKNGESTPIASYPYTENMLPRYAPATYYSLPIPHNDGNTYTITVYGAKAVDVYGLLDGSTWTSLKGSSGESVRFDNLGSRVASSWEFVVKAEFSDNGNATIKIEQEVNQW